jgi:hypothetical protein
MKRLFLLPVIVCAACGLVLLSTCKEEKEEPLHFETTAPTAYTFPETETSATFTIASNTAWTVEVTEGRDRCSVTPASGKSSATVTVRVTANPDYLQTHTMTLRLTAGDYTQDITITQAAPPCPDFNAGAIATAGQTVTVGGTPGTIGSAQAATGGDRHITYQWYKNGNVIEDATAASYTPPASVTATAGVNTYTRRAKDNTCNTTLTPSAGSWILTVVCPDFDPGTIAEAEQTINVGGTPETINSVQDASGAGSVTYQWYKNNIVISGATAAYYTPPPADATVVSANTYTRRAKDNTCNTTLTPSEGSWILTVICPFNSGTVAANGQTLNVGGTPETINSVQDAGGAGSVTYQWYKNNIAITGATDAYYTPPPTDATAVGAHTYTRRAKDNTCNTTLTPSEGSWVLTVVCPFNAGTIAATGQTIMIGGTPIAISSVQNASGIGTISYQWYKNDMAISGATDAYYTPPPTDATAVGAHTYTRRVKDNICNVTFTPSEGTWILTVVCPSFNPGAIATDGQTINVGGTPETINSVQDASGAGSVIYQWYKNNIVISGATAAYYTPPPADATVVSANTYTRRAKDNTCNTTLTPSEGSWVLTVVCPDFSPGAIATAGQAICSGNAVNTIPNSTNASGGDNNIFYQWRRNSITISDATATTYSPVAFNATVGSHIFTRWAKDGVCTTDCTHSAGQWV